MLSRLLSALTAPCRFLDEQLARRHLLRHLLILLLLVPAVLLVVLVVVVVGERIVFPLDLEWLEGSQIHHAYRLLHGLPLFRLEPSGFLPHPYPPVHPLLVAAVGAVAGVDFAQARAVSLAGLLIATAVVSYQVARHWPTREGRVALAVVVVGHVAATYGIVEGWYDTARVDSLMLMFVVLSAAPLARRELRWPDVLISAVLASISIYTKQTAVFFAATLCLVVLVRDWKKGVVMSLAVGALCGAALLILDRVTRGGFSYWIFTSRHQEFFPEKISEGFLLALDQAPFLALLPLLVLLPFLVKRDRGQGRGRPSARAVLWLAMLLTALLAGLVPYVKKGGYLNNLIPLWFLSGPVVLLLIGDLARAVRPVTRRWILAVVLVLQAIYLPYFIFDPEPASPGAGWRQRAEHLNRTVAALEGGVICPVCPFVPIRNGQPTPQASWIATLDAIWSRMPGVSAATYVKWIHRQRPRWLMLSDERVTELDDIRRILGPSYVLYGELATPELAPVWLTNRVSRMLYRRVDAPPVSAAAGPAARAAPR